MQRPYSLAAAVALALLLSGPGVRPAATASIAKPYKCIALGTLGGDFSHGTDVNDAGEVVGYSTFNPGTVTLNKDERAFYWKDRNGNNVSDAGEMIYLGSLGGLSVAQAINNNGVIVGTCSSSPRRAVLWNPGTTQPLDLNDLDGDGVADYPGWLLNGANDINDSGQIAGFGTLLADGTQHAYLLDLVTHTLTDLGPTSTTALGLSNAAAPMVVGSGTQTNGFLFDAGAGAFRSLSPLTTAWSVNDVGEVAGQIAVQVSGSTVRHPAYWKDVNGNGLVDAGEWTDLGTFGKESGLATALAQGINADGIVVGNTSGGKVEYGSVLQRAFGWKAGTLASSKEDLNNLTSAPFVLRHARSISDTGFIVGYGSSGTVYDTSSIDKAYLLKPN